MERDFIRRCVRSSPGADMRRRDAPDPASRPATDIAGIEAFQRDHNASVYRRQRTARRCGRDVLLNRAEAAALLRYQPAFAGKDVLDIGVGPGRTAAYLAPLAHRYQAIDYSSVMVAVFRQDFPNAAVALADMADMGLFEDASFDFVLAADNVFDAVGHADRLRTQPQSHGAPSSPLPASPAFPQSGDATRVDGALVRGARQRCAPRKATTVHRRLRHRHR